MRGNRAWERDDDGHEELWQALMERVCPVPNALAGRANPHRAYHEDLRLLGDLELALEKQRALLRACLERDAPNRRWLEERLRRIDAELAARGVIGQPAQGVTDAAPRRLPPPAPLNSPREAAEEVEREIERRQHMAWLRWRARQVSRMPDALGSPPSPSRPAPGPAPVRTPRPASAEADPWARAAEREWRVLAGGDDAADDAWGGEEEIL